MEGRKELAHRIIVLRDFDGVAVNGTASLRVTQDTSMVDKWCRSFICLTVELDQHPLDIKQVTMNGVQEPSCLEMFRRSAARSGQCQRIDTEEPSPLHRNAILLDDVPNAVPVSSNWSEAEQTKSGIAAVGGGEDRSVQDVPAMVGEDVG